MILRRPLWLLWAWATVVAAQTIPILTLTDQSPTIGYSPAIYGNGAESWNVTYSQSPWDIWPPTTENPMGVGTSVHWTNHTGATISFAFVGTAFEAFGYTTGNSTIQVTIDGSIISDQAAPNGSVTLANAFQLDYTRHQVQLELRGNGGVEFYGLHLFLEAGDDSAVYTNLTMSCTTANELNDAFLWSGNDWSPNITDVDTTRGTPNDSLSVAWSDRINASVSFSPPSNTSILLIYGSVDPYTGMYGVTLNSTVYQGSYTNMSTAPFQSYKPVTPWAESNQVLYFATLIPGYTYAVTLQISGAGQNHANTMDFGLFNVVFITTSSYTGPVTSSSLGPSPTGSSGPDSPARGSNKVGVILGAVLGSVAAILLIIGLSWLCIRRRLRADRARTTGSADDGKDFEMDVYDEAPEAQVSEVQPFSTADTQPHSSLDGGMAAPSEGKGLRPAKSGASASSSPTTRLHISGSPQDSSPVASPTSEGLDPSDPNHKRKRDILHSLNTDASTSASPSLPSASSESPTAAATATTTARTRDVDAGRIEEGEGMLPPDYNPAWAPERQQ